MKTLLLLTSLFLLHAPLALADNGGHDADSPLQLREIMRKMDRDMQALTRALVLGDWPRVALHAKRIADHGKPPLGERIKILALIKIDAGEFRALDSRVVEAAKELANTASASDAERSVDALRKMTSACLTCHTGFRGRIVNHFYK